MVCFIVCLCLLGTALQYISPPFEYVLSQRWYGNLLRYFLGVRQAPDLNQLSSAFGS